MSESLLERAVKRVGLERVLASFTPEQQAGLKYEWQLWARPEQLPPDGTWLCWLLLAGRGFGKSRTGAEWVRGKAKEMPGSHGALIGPTAADVRDVMVRELLQRTPDHEGLVYEPSKRRLVWTTTGASATLYSAEEPDRLRGPQHHWAWCFVSGTMVLLADGSEKPIERVVVGDAVWTRKGPRSVVASRLTARDAPTWRLYGSHGRHIEATGDHPVFANGEFRPLRMITPGTKLMSWQVPSSLMGSISSSTARTISETREGGCFTGYSGNLLMDGFQMDISSITSTKTSSTTGSKTSFSCDEETTLGTTEGVDGPPWSHPSDPRKLKSSGSAGSQSNESASDAEPNTGRAQLIAPGVERSAGSLQGITALRLESTGRSADVYDIAVDGEHEFFANGILVHNCDEIAAWQRPDDVWDMLMMTLRQGSSPQVVVSTTPRPIPIIKRLIEDPGTRITRGSTYDNAPNLSSSFIETVRNRYDGTKLGRQELYAEVLDKVEGALWNHDAIDRLRVRQTPQFKRVVVAVDPSGSAKKTADEAGIVVAALGIDGHGYVLEDLSGRYSPREMAEKACDAYHRHRADRLVAEDNFGGQIVADLISLTDRRVAYRSVHASRGKIVRAEPVAALYEQGKVHHVGMFIDLEHEMCNYAPLTSTESPGRMDALVWALTDLMLYQATQIQRGVFRVHGA